MTHISFALETRQTWDSLKAMVRQADSVMSGPSASIAKAETLNSLLGNIAQEAAKVRKMVR